MKRKDFTSININPKRERRAFFEHEYAVAGTFPYTRGVSSTMYLQNPMVLKTLDEYKNKYVISLNEKNSKQALIKAFIKACNYIKKETFKKVPIDVILSQIIFIQKSENSMFSEIVKLKTARTIWAEITLKFQPKKQESSAMQVAYQVKTESISEIMTAFFCGTQHLILPENCKLSNQEIAYFLEEETQITKTVDPWGGTFALENKMDQLIQVVWQELLKNNCF